MICMRVRSTCMCHIKFHNRLGCKRMRYRATGTEKSILICWNEMRWAPLFAYIKTGNTTQPQTTTTHRMRHDVAEANTEHTMVMKKKKNTRDKEKIRKRKTKKRNEHNKQHQQKKQKEKKTEEKERRNTNSRLNTYLLCASHRLCAMLNIILTLCECYLCTSLRRTYYSNNIFRTTKDDFFLLLLLPVFHRPNENGSRFKILIYKIDMFDSMCEMAPIPATRHWRLPFEWCALRCVIEKNNSNSIVIYVECENWHAIWSIWRQMKLNATIK